MGSPRNRKRLLLSSRRLYKRRRRVGFIQQLLGRQQNGGPIEERPSERALDSLVDVPRASRLTVGLLVCLSMCVLGAALASGASPEPETNHQHTHLHHIRRQSRSMMLLELNSTSQPLMVLPEDSEYDDSEDQQQQQQAPTTSTSQRPNEERNDLEPQPTLLGRYIEPTSGASSNAVVLANSTTSSNNNKQQQQGDRGQDSTAISSSHLSSMSLMNSLLSHIDKQWKSAEVILIIVLSSILNLVTVVGNIMVLISFKMDRSYFSVTRPLTYRAKRTTKHAILMISCAWILSLTIWTPAIFTYPYYKGRTVQGTDKCEIEFVKANTYLTFVTAILAFYIPVLIMIYLYWRIWLETKKRYRDLTTLFLVSGVGAAAPARSTRPALPSASQVQSQARKASLGCQQLSNSQQQAQQQQQFRRSPLGIPQQQQHHYRQPKQLQRYLVPPINAGCSDNSNNNRINDNSSIDNSTNLDVRVKQNHATSPSISSNFNALLTSSKQQPLADRLGIQKLNENLSPKNDHHQSHSSNHLFVISSNKCKRSCCCCPMSTNHHANCKSSKVKKLPKSSNQRRCNAKNGNCGCNFQELDASQVEKGPIPPCSCCHRSPSSSSSGSLAAVAVPAPTATNNCGCQHRKSKRQGDRENLINDKSMSSPDAISKLDCGQPPNSNNLNNNSNNTHHHHHHHHRHHNHLHGHHHHHQSHKHHRHNNHHHHDHSHGHHHVHHKHSHHHHHHHNHSPNANNNRHQRQTRALNMNRDPTKVIPPSTQEDFGSKSLPQDQMANISIEGLGSKLSLLSSGYQLLTGSSAKPSSSSTGAMITRKVHPTKNNVSNDHQDVVSMSAAAATTNDESVGHESGQLTTSHDLDVGMVDSLTQQPPTATPIISERSYANAIMKLANDEPNKISQRSKFTVDSATSPIDFSPSPKSEEDFREDCETRIVSTGEKFTFESNDPKLSSSRPKSAEQSLLWKLTPEKSGCPIRAIGDNLKAHRDCKHCKQHWTPSYHHHHKFNSNSKRSGNSCCSAAVLAHDVDCKICYSHSELHQRKTSSNLKTSRGCPDCRIARSPISGSLSKKQDAQIVKDPSKPLDEKSAKVEIDNDSYVKLPILGALQKTSVDAQMQQNPIRPSLQRSSGSQNSPQASCKKGGNEQKRSKKLSQKLTFSEILIERTNYQQAANVTSNESASNLNNKEGRFSSGSHFDTMQFLSSASNNETATRQASTNGSSSIYPNWIKRLMYFGRGRRDSSNDNGSTTNNRASNSLIQAICCASSLSPSKRFSSNDSYPKNSSSEDSEATCGQQSNSNNSSSKPSYSSHHPIQPKSERKAAKTLSTLLLVFIVTWLPYNILVLIKTLSGDESQVPEKIWNFSYYLCYINSTINPLCYALCNAQFRRTYMRILKCKLSNEHNSTRRLVPIQSSTWNKDLRINSDCPATVTTSNNGGNSLRSYRAHS